MRKTPHALNTSFCRMFASYIFLKYILTNFTEVVVSLPALVRFSDDADLHTNVHGWSWSAGEMWMQHGKFSSKMWKASTTFSFPASLEDLSRILTPNLIVTSFILYFFYLERWDSASHGSRFSFSSFTDGRVGPPNVLSSITLVKIYISWQLSTGLPYLI